jgi:hypothetical protein
VDARDLAVATGLVLACGAYLTALLLGWPLLVELFFAALFVVILALFGGVRTVGYSLTGLGILMLSNAARIITGIEGLPALAMLLAFPVFQRGWRIYRERPKYAEYFQKSRQSSRSSNRTRLLTSILILALSVISIGYLVYPSVPMTSVTGVTLTSTKTDAYPRLHNVFTLTTDTSLSACYDYYGNFCGWIAVTTTYTAFAYAETQGTSYAYSTDTAYLTSSWSKYVPPYSYVLSTQNPLTVITILAVCLILATSALTVGLRKGRRVEPKQEQTKKGATKYCRECGTKILRESVFCEECGSKLVE